jgi:hypothetical protein
VRLKLVDYLVVPVSRHGPDSRPGLQLAMFLLLAVLTRPVGVSADGDLIGKPERPGTDVARTPTEIDVATAV